MRITLKDIEASEKICEEATGGPYTIAQVHKSGQGSDFFVKDANGFVVARLPEYEHARLLGHARTALPARNALAREMYELLKTAGERRCEYYMRWGYYSCDCKGRELTEEGKKHERAGRWNEWPDCFNCQARRLVERMEEDNNG